MSETTSIPTLTLDPNGTQAAAQAAALEEEIKAAAEKAQNPVEKVEIPFDQYGISEGEYTLVIQPFNSADEALFDTVVLNINYTGEEDIVVPSTADTGGMFKNLNISRADYLITGLGLFLIVGIGGIVFIHKHGKSNKRRR